jgi:hypothetical protein
MNKHLKKMKDYFSLLLALYSFYILDVAAAFTELIFLRMLLSRNKDELLI